MAVGNGEAGSSVEHTMSANPGHSLRLLLTFIDRGTSHAASTPMVLSQESELVFVFDPS